MGGPILIQACLNGARFPAAHPALPVTPAQIADDVHAVVLAGADAVHLHCKDDEGLDTFDPDTHDAVITAAKVIAPGLPISVTTGAWALPDPAARVRAVHAWSVLPDVASVNWHEVGSLAVVEALMEREIGVEAGLWSMDDVQAWAASPVRDEMRRVLVELPDGIDKVEMIELARAMIGGVRAVAPEMPLLLHGEGESAWPALRHALRLGLQTRIGLEDTLHLPGGEDAPDNATLVRVARELADELA
ncbi:3-keto-5-aminohexanoate cleavage protein [Aeromicrobium sp.]|uniref:3-keto-5-aminohexanoate cleavage protein n=1 Tax=Aeromicrobium sp. TaxID=1871063 RepID=UPI0028B0A5F7|nr:3-keto-5-aminohexanoate cleavage protein [Aeromicrobium sp.]